MNGLLSLLFTFTPLKFYIQSFWRDEAFSFLMAKQPILQIILTTAKDANPPLYYLLLHIWMLCFGTSEIAIRTISFLFFLASLYVVGLFLMEFFKVTTKWMLVYLLLFALNPLLTYYAFEGRMYSMFAFFSLLSFYFLYKQNVRYYFVTAVIGLYTHYFMMFVLISQVAYLYLFQRKSIKIYLGEYVKIAVLFLPWILLVLASRPPVSQQFWVPKPTFASLLLLPATVYTGYEDLIGFTYKSLPVISLSLSLFILYALYEILRIRKSLHTKSKHIHNGQLGSLLLCWVVIPLFTVFAISLFKPILLPRYTIFITIGFLFLLVYFLQSIDKNMRILVFVVLVLFSLHYEIYQVTMRTKADIRKPLREIHARLNKNDVVYVVNPYNFHPAEYYINDRVVYIYGKSYEQLPWFIGKVLIPKDRTTTSLPSYPSKAYILTSDTDYSIEALY